MQFFNSQSKIAKKILAAFATVILVLGVSLLQSNILKVKAEVQVLLVSDTALPFGLVFPGEQQTKTYTVQLDTSAATSAYTTTLSPVPGSLNLCPYLQITNVDSPAEPDILSSSSLSAPADIIDNWQVKLLVPGIKGQIAQDHKGGIVVSGGDFSCKITVTTDTSGGGDNGGCEGLDCHGGGGSSTGTPVSDLEVDKTVDQATSSVGSSLLYNILITNHGPDKATSVKVSEALPPDIIFVSATSTQGSYATSTNIWEVGDLANGASATLQISATVNGGTVLVNSVTAVSGSIDPDLSNNNSSATTTIPGGGAGGCLVNCGSNGGGGGGGGGTFTPSYVPPGEVKGESITAGGSNPPTPKVLGETLPRTGLPAFFIILAALMAVCVSVYLRRNKKSAGSK